jgi:hypothetical protein
MEMNINHSTHEQGELYQVLCRSTKIKSEPMTRENAAEHFSTCDIFCPGDYEILPATQPEPPMTNPMTNPMDSNAPWTIDDPRMWKEQCRVGDVAFQHLFCISKGKPVPTWVNDRLPMMYSTLSEVKRLREELAQAKLRGDCLQVEVDNWVKSTRASEIRQENDTLREEQLQDRAEIRKLRAENLKLLDDSTIQYIGLTDKIVALQAQLKEAKQCAADWEIPDWELRQKLEAVKEMLESKCPYCLNGEYKNLCSYCK